LRTLSLPVKSILSNQKTFFMKKLLFLLLPAALLLSFSLPSGSLTKEERENAVKSLKETKSNLLQSLKNLSDAQVNFKAAPERWSIKECVEHITLAEKGLWQMEEASLKAAATPDKRSEVKITDDGLMKIITDRSQKQTAPEPFRPEKYKVAELSDVVKDFTAERNELIEFVKKTDDDMRNHMVTMPFGTIDSYQLLLMISGHCNRHTQQINEVKADPNYPKN
jgi:hypothetical protein